MLNVRFTKVSDGQVVPFNQVVETVTGPDITPAIRDFVVAIVGASIGNHTGYTDEKLTEDFIAKEAEDMLPLPADEIRRIFYREYTAEVWNG